MSLRVAPDDARRGGLVIIGASAGDGPRLARRYADGGYETVVAEANDDLRILITSLTSPVFAMAFPDAAVIAWTLSNVAATSIVGDKRMASAVGMSPAGATILHLDAESHEQLAQLFEAAQPDLPVHVLGDSEDGERLFYLRTLRLFSANAGGWGEV